MQKKRLQQNDEEEERESESFAKERESKVEKIERNSIC
jgi:hypothetical protein